MQHQPLTLTAYTRTHVLVHLYTSEHAYVHSTQNIHKKKNSMKRKKKKKQKAKPRVVLQSLRPSSLFLSPNKKYQKPREYLRRQTDNAQSKFLCTSKTQTLMCHLVLDIITRP